MNNFSIIGRCKNIKRLNQNNYIINIISKSPLNESIIVPIHISKNIYIKKIKANDLLGINGFIDIQDSVIIFLASKIIWLPSK